ncbi:hypothetical protein ASG01_00425 [Chryseobacterium sp. Leaf180]|uniref:hypothetical protein n=1 Tax=Chryseobacterium sp. Leaf180 TaxID=1736289 RepID=UPI0006F8AF53|nr:hypothetical protein [Chryseobacterium sp. Leaf180]KQR94389.1 hypothetical protein ASG01_00425 [Chryseobacterium sp. Leaf180]
MKVTIQNILGMMLFFFSTVYFCQSTDPKLKKISDNTKKSMQMDYTLQKEEICDLNNDKKKDVILIYQPKNVDKEMESFDTPVVLLLSQNSDYIKIENSNILYSYIPNSSVLDNNLVVKNEFFTLEQTEGNGNNKRKTYITFRYDQDTRQVFLSKYGIETSFPGKTKNITKTKLFSSKDFGKIKFNDFNTETISSSLK